MVALSTQRPRQVSQHHSDNIQSETSGEYRVSGNPSLYDGDNVVADLSDHGGALGVDRFYVTPFLDQNLSMTDASGTYWFSQDGLGSVRTLTDSSGAVKNAYDYTAFGEAYATTEGIAQRYTYTGREKSSVGGPMYYRYRHVWNSLGRFQQRAPEMWLANSYEGHFFPSDADPFGLPNTAVICGKTVQINEHMQVIYEGKSYSLTEFKEKFCPTNPPQKPPEKPPEGPPGQRTDVSPPPANTGAKKCEFVMFWGHGGSYAGKQNTGGKVTRKAREGAGEYDPECSGIGVLGCYGLQIPGFVPSDWPDVSKAPIGKGGGGAHYNAGLGNGRSGFQALVRAALASATIRAKAICANEKCCCEKVDIRLTCTSLDDPGGLKRDDKTLEDRFKGTGDEFKDFRCGQIVKSVDCKGGDGK